MSNDGSVGGLSASIGGGSVVSKCGVTASLRGGLVGGLSAYIDSQVSNCFTRGSINGISVDEWAGLGGFVYQAYSESYINKCYAAMCINDYAENSSVGGFAAYKDNDAIISGCYYDSDISGQSDTGRGTPKTTAEMQDQATYIDWDFDNIWTMKQGYQ